MAALTTFGAGFLARPLGALVLGSYIDRHGRRTGLILTLALMSIGTFAIAVTPGYASIGLAAPLLILISRLIQGCSAGVELGGVSVYLSEIATPGNKGFYVSWQSGQPAGSGDLRGPARRGADPVSSARKHAVLGLADPSSGRLCYHSLRFPAAPLAGGDRGVQRPAPPPYRRRDLRSMAENWRIVVLGMMMVLMTTVSFYLITVYTPTFGRRVHHLTSTQALLVTLCVGVSNLFGCRSAGRSRIGPVVAHC